MKIRDTKSWSLNFETFSVFVADIVFVFYRLVISLRLLPRAGSYRWICALLLNIPPCMHAAPP